MKENDFSPVDWLFADSLLKFAPRVSEGVRKQIASVMGAARLGHLCIQVEDPALFPHELVQRMDDQNAALQKPLCLYGDLLYLQKNWIYETRVLKHIKRLQRASPRSVDKPYTLPEDLNKEQQQAVEQALQQPVSLITGGPGTGKTYTAARLIATFLNIRQGRIAIGAPTGKAASALESALSKIMKLPPEVVVGTLHSLLGQRWKSHEEIPLPFDLIIIDESSMIDAPLFAALLGSVSSESHLVLMGDPDQLPPVEVGSLFADVLALDLFPSTRLIQCMRSDELIMQLALSIRLGHSDEAIRQINTHGMLHDLGFSRGNITQIYEKLWKEVNDRFPTRYRLEPDPQIVLTELMRFRILSCLRSGPLGVDALNHFLVNRFYMQAPEGSFLAFPIILTRNDAELELFNGQMGVLIKRKRAGQFAQISSEDTLVFPERSLPAAVVMHFDYAYCLSVHKAQGSEYDEVLLLVPPGSEHFGKEVLYTAVTRTKHTLKIDGNLEIIKEAIETSSRKQSGLENRFFATLQSL